LPTENHQLIKELVEKQSIVHQIPPFGGMNGGQNKKPNRRVGNGFIVAHQKLAINQRVGRKSEALPTKFRRLGV